MKRLNPISKTEKKRREGNEGGELGAKPFTKTLYANYFITSGSEIAESGLVGRHLRTLHDLLTFRIVQRCSINLIKIALIVELFVVLGGVILGVEKAVGQLDLALSYRRGCMGNIPVTRSPVVLCFPHSVSTLYARRSTRSCRAFHSPSKCSSLSGSSTNWFVRS